MPKHTTRFLLAALLVAMTLAALDLHASPQSRALLTERIDEANLVTLAGNTRPEANVRNDRGAVSASYPLHHMQLVLRRPPEQEQGAYGLLSTGPTVLSLVTTETIPFPGGAIVTAPGSGYTSAPTSTLSGGGGSGATCTAAISGGGVSSITLTNPGSGYVAPPECTLSGGGGSGATCGAFLGATTFQPAYPAGTGWDFATGIGSVNAYNLVTSSFWDTHPCTVHRLEKTDGAVLPGC